MGQMIPTELSLQHTYDFITNHLPRKGRILEVGCGRGDLAAKLSQQGFSVLAIDISDEAIKESVSKGVQAQCVDFLKFPANESFDAILFTSSLHHIFPIEKAVAHAYELL